MMASENKISKLIDDFLQEYPEANWSFGHVVLRQRKTGRRYIQYCLQPKRIEYWLEHHHEALAPEIEPERIEEIRSATVSFLESLLRYTDIELESVGDD